MDRGIAVCRLNGLVTKVSNARTGLLYASVFPVEVNVEINVSMEGGIANDR